MAASRLLVAPGIKDRLGGEGLARVARCLWPVDCQSCGRALGAEPPALAVDELGPITRASLHHPSCRESAWNDSGIVDARMAHGEHASWRSRSLRFNIDVPGQRPGAMLVVNPSLETVGLHETEAGWDVEIDAVVRGTGLVPFGESLILDRPIRGFVGQVTGTDVAVVGQDVLHQVYSAPADPPVVALVRELGGFLLAFTHDVMPGDLDDRAMATLFTSPNSRAGFVALQGTAAARAATAPAGERTGTLYVLHFSKRHRTVGPLVARTEERLNDRQAKQWAEEVLGQGDKVRLIGWTRLDTKRPDDGWETTDALSVNSYMLRRHEEAWLLVNALSRASGDPARSENEARAWGSAVLRHRLDIGPMPWQPGATTAPGSTTLYATW